MPPYDPCRFNFLKNQKPGSSITMECFLPNGLCIPMQVQADTTIGEFKALLWIEAKKLPLFDRLKDQRFYVLSCVDSKGGIEALFDENRTILDVQPFKPYFKISEKKGDESEKLLNSKISMLIGKSLTEFDNMDKIEEVADFRRQYRIVCEQYATQRRRASWGVRAMYSYPPQFAPTNDIPDYIRVKISKEFIINVAVVKSITYTFHIPVDCTTTQLVLLALRKKAFTLKLPTVENHDDFVLKRVGRSNYLFGSMVEGEEDPKLIAYKYIQDCLTNETRPQLMLVQKCDLVVEDRIRGMSIKEIAPPLPPKAEKRTISLWDIGPQSMVKIKIVCAMNINSPGMKVFLKCGIYHGGESLCDIMSTSSQPGSSPNWNEFLEFNLSVCNIPRMARLCFCLWGFPTRRERKDPVALAWANITMFDYKGLLRSGPTKLYCWPCHGNECNGTPLHPLGTVVSNSNQESSPCLLFDFTKFAEPVSYPTDDKILELAATTVQSRNGLNDLMTKGNKEHKKLIKEIIGRDPLLPIIEQDKELLWFLRAECCNDYPESLPKLLRSVKWNIREHVAQIYFLLHSWRKDKMITENVLELLDYTFADAKVRKFAVELLDNLNDSDLEQYLLQLVQVLKYESYLDCSLARFLLQRALNNRRLGHFLFWHLRSEMHNSQVAVRFGLMLEAYFRGSSAHIESLTKQHEAINKLKTVTELLKNSSARMEEKLGLMRECLSRLNDQGSFSNLESPLDPSIRLKGLKIDRCKYLNSAKKPLWLTFENEEDPESEELIIFKNGDDLRQDMLTLQILKIMDVIWKMEGLNLMLEPYNCLSTGYMVGLIEVVDKAETVARIQAKSGITKGVFKDNVLFAWMRKIESDPEKFEVLVDRFRRSCAGYCVATYVLGIGDRHNDNIMMKENGEFFHIDFGHFLGNFKKKFNIRRERVPFVLTSDFLYIICHGQINRSSKDFEEFRLLCEDAFLKLRHKGSLFMTLFAMMLYTGIPELQRPEDVDYIRSCLALTKTEEESKEHFRDNFNVAYQKRAATSVNFFIHNVKHHWI
eukprot:gene15189-16756_t